MPHPAFECSVVTQHLPEQSSPRDDLHAHAYTVTIRNTGDVAAQLIGRHWVITHGDGEVEEVRGLGVVGQQPLLQPGERFEYTSWTRIRTPHGHMQGQFFCMTTDARWFEVEVPAFVLSLPGMMH